jgi:hypothetical protein
MFTCNLAYYTVIASFNFAGYIDWIMFVKIPAFNGFLPRLALNWFLPRLALNGLYQSAFMLLFRLCDSSIAQRDV